MAETKGHSPGRDCVIDVMKFICISNVVIFHAVGQTVLPDVWKVILPGYTLQVFFMLSGWLDLGREPDSWGAVSKAVGRKFKGLLIPYVSFSILTIIWHIIICVGFSNPYVSDTYTGWKVIFRDIFSMIGGVGVGTLWFLPPLFVSYAVLQIVKYLAYQKTKHGNVFILIVCAVLFVGTCFLKNFFFWPQDMLEKLIYTYREFFYRITFGSFYTVLGYFFHREWDRIKRFTIPIIIVSIPMAFLSYNFITRPATFDFFLTIPIFMIVMNLPKPNEKVTKMLSPLTFLGINSLSIMILHYNFLYPVEKLYVKDWLLFVVNYSTTIVLMLILLRTKWYNLALGKKPGTPNAK